MIIASLINNPVKFMAENLITVDASNSGESKAPIPMRLVANGTCSRKGGERVNIYGLRCGADQIKGPPKDGDEDFNGYWCHYEPGKTFYTFLGSDAQLMFTATMNGCSFGIGMANPHGEVLVGHSNLPGADESGQNALLAQGLGGQGTVLSGTFYRGRKKVGPDLLSGIPGAVLRTMNDATTFGVRTESKWKFYTMIYCRKRRVQDYINRMTNQPAKTTIDEIHSLGGEKICSRKFTLI